MYDLTRSYSLALAVVCLLAVVTSLSLLALPPAGSGPQARGDALSTATGRDTA